MIVSLNLLYFILVSLFFFLLGLFVNELYNDKLEKAFVKNLKELEKIYDEKDKNKK